MSKTKHLTKNHVYVQSNCDKTKHEKWGDQHHHIDNLMNIPKPYAALLTAQPNCGKSMVIKNILIHMDPPPDNIIIAHAETWNPDTVANAAENDWFINKTCRSIPEYEDLKAIFLKALPPICWWDQFKKQHNVLIIDDVNLKEYAGRSNQRRAILDKTWSWCRTHRNVTILCALQSIYQQGVPSIYRFSNVFILWKMRDQYVQQQLGRNCGVDKDEWKQLFSLCHSQYDNIMIDDTPGTPCRFRLNLSQEISLNGHADDSESEESSESSESSESESE